MCNYEDKNIKNKNIPEGLNEKEKNNSEDPYGYDFVPTIAHWTNIDEQRKNVKKLEIMTDDEKSKKDK